VSFTEVIANLQKMLQKITEVNANKTSWKVHQGKISIKIPVFPDHGFFLDKISF
jgi:hypothetical protein